MTSGRMPPTRKSPRQPNRGSTCPPTRPASDPPSGMHTIVSVTAKGRCRLGTYSDESAAAFGMAPPRPSPAKNRSTVSIVTPPANDTKIVSTPNATTLPSSATRRPNRSPIIPPLAHQRRQRGAQQLVVEAVENDRHRRREHQQLLIRAPLRVVEGRADVDRGHRGCFRS